MFVVQEELKKLPDKPGVYIMHGKSDEILYVGKAVNLKNRVRSYFRESTVKSPKIQKMVGQIAWFEYIITDSELEALVLENNLIKEHNPKYNTMLKDDKTYPYIRVTLGEDYPRVMAFRQMKKDKSRYFGPYTSMAVVKDVVELINKLFGLRTCRKNLPKDCGRDRPCLKYHMGLCKAPCTGNVPKEEYDRQVQKALDFLNGDYNGELKRLKEKMTEASERLEFEEAARCRDLYAAVMKISQRQKITDSHGEDKDIIAMAKDNEDAIVQVFFVRGGKLIGREHFCMTNVSESTNGEILSDFVKQYYAGTPYVPKELLLQEEIEDMEMIERYVSMKRGSRVRLTIPKIGKKEKLVELAAQNAALVLSKDKEKIKREEGRTIGAVREIETLLQLSDVKRMEAFDISNTNGFENVGSMVVYEKGKPKRSDYRKFRIKTVAGPDDYACMHEVLTRRFLHGIEEKSRKTQENIPDEAGSFDKFPDLILMDGGKGQVNIALSVLAQLGLSIPVCGMVKDDSHRTRGLYYNNVEIPIDSSSEGFKLITRIQDEAHRFAIEYHRSLRNKKQVDSSLDKIPGVGAVRRKALMKHFGSIEDIKNAQIEELCEIPEIPQSVAEEIYVFFHGEWKK